ncbi:hypothetical protein NDK43_07240 [Neobacillus pocheonensis]|uniref:Uncharacterized protein n=1 Tax=Neobacillus pocheonensis TaxID=363869 RepID=A0ABT0W7D2_9BACI|nr:hypothetical protein [Neobacillus pocheonensis]
MRQAGITLKVAGLEAYIAAAIIYWVMTIMAESFTTFLEKHVTIHLYMLI